MVGANGVINADECGANAPMTSTDRMFHSDAEQDEDVRVLKYGYCLGDDAEEKNSETAVSSNGAGGGVICLVSGGAVRIDRGGVLSSNGSKGGAFGGGSICVVCDGAFITFFIS